MSGAVPAIHALMLLEPLSRRYLDLITGQLDAQFTAGQSAGRLTPLAARNLRTALADAVRSMRGSGQVPSGLPSPLRRLLASAPRFLEQADHYDPAELAAVLRPHTPVSCSDDDTEISCADVRRLLTGLQRGAARIAEVHLAGVDHVLKQDPRRTAAAYGSPLPFSTQLQSPLARLVRTRLH